MTRLIWLGSRVVFLFPLLLLGGCPPLTFDLADGSLTISGSGVITVELINDTDFDVDPRIVFDDDSGFLARMFPSDLLDTGLLAPGEVLAFDFECDELGLILSDEPDQFVGGVIYRDFPSAILERGDEFDCGDLIQFQFLGNADSFGVILAVNGFVVD